MTKKMTITLEDTLIEELNHNSKKTGKKKTQIIREALHAYLGLLDKEDKKILWEKENKKAIEKYNKDVEDEGLILQDSRMF